MQERFLVELYLPRSATAEAETMATAVRAAAEAMTREGSRIRYLRSIFVPEDETCFLVFEAADREWVLAAAERAGLEVDRILQSQERGAA